MFQDFSSRFSTYFSWILTASLLSQPYDYFDFVNTFELDKRRANTAYLNTMKAALSSKKGDKKLLIAKVINDFNARDNQTQSEFAKKYKEFWQAKEKTTSEERMEKRRRLAAENSNEVICYAYESITKKIAAVATGSTATESTTSATTAVTTAAVADETDGIISCLEDITYDAMNEKFIFPDQSDAIEDKTLIKLRELTGLPNKELDQDCQTLLASLDSCAPSAIVLRKIIRKHACSPNEQFDLSVHYATNFIEVMAVHFLNLIDSPRNPLQQQQLERNTAFLTTIPILHNLFVDCSDIIDMQWVEKQAPSTGETKWDGIAFQVNKKSITPLFVELSGGIDFNNGPGKAKGDEKKMLKQFIDLLKIRKAEGDESPTQYYVRYHDLKLYFESLTFFDDCFVKRTHLEAVCPTNPATLKKFLQSTPLLYRYREAILCSMK